MAFSSGWDRVRANALPARRAALAQRNPQVLRLGDPAESERLAGIELNKDLVSGLADLHAAPKPLHSSGTEYRLVWSGPHNLPRPLVHHALVQRLPLVAAPPRIAHGERHLYCFS